MCSMCNQYPCHPRCPNALEPEPVLRCEKCGEGIWEGDEYFETRTGGICEECIDEMTATELFDLVGESLSIARREENGKYAINRTA